VRESSGLGLGLFISRQIIEAPAAESASMMRKAKARASWSSFPCA